MASKDILKIPKLMHRRVPFFANNSEKLVLDTPNATSIFNQVVEKVRLIFGFLD